MLRLAFCALIAACAARAAERKPGWVERESGRWPREMYVTGVGSADDRAAAEDRARADLARVFTTHVSSALSATESEDNVRTDRGSSHAQQVTVVDETRSTTDKVLEGVEIAEVWQDPSSRQTYALAVLDRQQAAARIEARLEEMAQAARPLRARLAAPDKVLALNAALRLLRLEQERHAVEKELQIVLPTRARKPSMEDAARELLSHVSVRVTVTGDDQGLVRAGLAKSLGLRDGWYWSRASVAMVLKDSASSRTLLQLTETARDASRAEGEADRRVLGKVSERLRSAVAAALVASAAESGSP